MNLQLARQILDDPAQASRVIPLKSGSGNKVWRIRCAGRTWVLKWNVADNPVERLAFLEAADSELAEELAAYTPLVDAAQAEDVQCSGFWTLRPYRGGTHYAFDRDQLKQAMQIPSILARISIPSRGSAGIGTNYLHHWKREHIRLLAQVLEWLESRYHMRLFTLVAAHAPEILAVCASVNMSRRLAHCDLHGRNLLYVNDALSCAIDWEELDVSFGPLDHGKMLWLLCRKGRSDFDLDDLLVDVFWRATCEGDWADRAAIPLLGAAYFIPRLGHLESLEARAPETLAWYISWLETFWRRYPRMRHRLQERLKHA
jgi:hypothetical protein